MTERVLLIIFLYSLLKSYMMLFFLLMAKKSTNIKVGCGSFHSGIVTLE